MRWRESLIARCCRRATRRSGLVLVVMVMVGRERIHRWVLWLPNLVIRKVTGRKAALVVPEGDAS